MASMPPPVLGATTAEIAPPDAATAETAPRIPLLIGGGGVFGGGGCVVGVLLIAYWGAVGLIT
jgi:hypothetical protein